MAVNQELVDKIRAKLIKELREDNQEWSNTLARMLEQKEKVTIQGRVDSDYLDCLLFDEDIRQHNRPDDYHEIWKRLESGQ